MTSIKIRRKTSQIKPTYGVWSFNVCLETYQKKAGKFWLEENNRVEKVFFEQHMDAIRYALLLIKDALEERKKLKEEQGGANENGIV